MNKIFDWSNMYHSGLLFLSFWVSRTRFVGWGGLKMPKCELGKTLYLFQKISVCFRRLALDCCRLTSTFGFIMSEIVVFVCTSFRSPLIDWVEVLRPRQPIRVMSSRSLYLTTLVMCIVFRQKLTTLFLNQRKGENRRRKYLIKNVAGPGGDRTRDLQITSRTRVRLSHRGRLRSTLNPSTGSSLQWLLFFLTALFDNPLK